MTERIESKTNTIIKEVRNTVGIAYYEIADELWEKIVERERLIDRLLTNGEPFLTTRNKERFDRICEKRQQLLIKKWELFWVEKTLCELRLK